MGFTPHERAADRPRGAEERALSGPGAERLGDDPRLRTGEVVLARVQVVGIVAQEASELHTSEVDGQRRTISPQERLVEDLPEAVDDRLKPCPPRNARDRS